jgi:hypothetical protein
MTPETTDGRFDPEKHEYRIVVPSVTQVLADVLPPWRASEWHLQRGQAVHACCAMIARGQEFTNDPQIDGQVRAARLWFAQVKPEIIVVERPMFSRRYQFAGTPDLICRIGSHNCVVDFKARMTPAVRYQTGAYGLLYDEHTGRDMPAWGVGVELHEDGTYRMSERYQIVQAARAFLALLTAYNVRRECGVRGDGESYEE